MTDERKHSEGELTRLADGSLPADRQADLLAQVRQSPELTAALAEQERAVTMLRALDEPAPASLRARVDELTGASAPRAAPRAGGARFVLPGATAIAAAAAAVVILVSGGDAAPTVPAAARLALASATLPPPPVNPNDVREPHPRAAPASRSPPGAPRRAGRPTARAPTRSDGRQITTVFYEGRTRQADRLRDRQTARPCRASTADTVTRYGVRFTLQQSGRREAHQLGARRPHVRDRGPLRELRHAAGPGHRRRAAGGHQLAGRAATTGPPTCSRRGAVAGRSSETRRR